MVNGVAWNRMKRIPSPTGTDDIIQMERISLQIYRLQEYVSKHRLKIVFVLKADFVSRFAFPSQLDISSLSHKDKKVTKGNYQGQRNNVRARLQVVHSR